MDRAPTLRLTPWVGRLLLVNAAGFVLLSTVFTAPRFLAVLRFDPATFTQRPWTAFTYLFVHGGLIHFAANSLAIFMFGPPVERKLGGRRFLAYYLYCGVGAALFAFGLAGVLTVGPFIGASGALFGIVLAFATHWPEAELRLLPLPMTVTARTAFGILLGIDVLTALATSVIAKPTGIAHLAHVGGAAAGYLFFRIQQLTARRQLPRAPAVAHRPVVTPMRVEEAVAEPRPTAPAVDHQPSVDLSDAEIDRVLDKISQLGIESLTLQERRLLAEASERKRNQQL